MDEIVDLQSMDVVEKHDIDESDSARKVDGDDGAGGGVRQVHDIGRGPVRLSGEYSGEIEPVAGSEIGDVVEAGITDIGQLPG